MMVGAQLYALILCGGAEQDPSETSYAVRELSSLGEVHQVEGPCIPRSVPSDTLMISLGESIAWWACDDEGCVLQESLSPTSAIARRAAVAHVLSAAHARVRVQKMRLAEAIVAAEKSASPPAAAAVAVLSPNATFGPTRRSRNLGVTAAAVTVVGPSGTKPQVGAEIGVRVHTAEWRIGARFGVQRGLQDVQAERGATAPLWGADLMAGGEHPVVWGVSAQGEIGLHGVLLQGAQLGGRERMHLAPSVSVGLWAPRLNVAVLEAWRIGVRMQAPLSDYALCIRGQSAAPQNLTLSGVAAAFVLQWAPR